MASPVEPRQQVQFAEFSLDVRTGELWQDGEKLALPNQCFQILAVLLEHPGEMVTREALVKRLWASDVFVDFEGSLNKAIKRLREALHDAADQPRFIETLPRRGYRFIASVARAQDRVTETKGLVGKKVSHYRVLEVIGGGGMGLVYKAEDVKLGRRVALKFLPEELAADSLTLRRFEREAQTASSLNHLNICTIYEVEEYDGQPFIVMELLEGETVRDRLAAGDGALPLEELLDIALQVSDGLKAAHELGIIHRDIKPANIFVTDKGVCKILDFGLAKLAVDTEGVETAATAAQGEGALKGRGFSRANTAPPSELRALQPRLWLECAPNEKNGDSDGTPEGVPLQNRTLADATLTRTGVAMGTAGYMSPEQLRGEKLDARTDLFSFGLVLYEMATGQRAFSGETAEVVHDAILNNSPVPVRELNSTLPGKLVTTIAKALEKDREKRYQSALEMRVELEDVRSGKRARVRQLWTWASAVILFAVLTAAGWLSWHWRNTIKLTHKDTIVLADFTNSTGDPVFDGTLKQALGIHLEQSPFLNVLSEQKVGETLKLMDRPRNERLTYEVAREVCVRSKSTVLMSGSIASVGEHFMIAAKAADCHSGDTLASAEAEAQNRNQVLRTLQDVGNELRKKLGESLPSVEKFNQPLDEATTSSLEALQAFSQARKMKEEKSDAEALPYLQRAVELDPNFAYAYSLLGVTYHNLFAYSLASENFKRAYELRDRASARERFYIEGNYYGLVTCEIDKAIQIYTQWIQTYPGDYAPHGSLSRYLIILGRYELANAEAREALRIKPGNSQPAYYLMESYIAMNRLDEAKEAFEAVRSRGVDYPGFHWLRYSVAFLQSDEAAMREQITWTIGKPEAEQVLFFEQSETEAYYGRFAKAREFSQRMLESSRLAVSREFAAASTALKGLREAEVGNIVRARRAAAEALQLTPGRNVDGVAGLALARAGEVAQAQKLVDKLNQDFPLDTMMQNYWLPTIRAAMELQKKNPAKAIELLQTADPYELGHAAYLYPAYVRGQAYLDAGMPQEAVTEFQKMLDHPGIAENNVTGALAHLQLGRAQVMMGDKAAARKSYQDFLTLWKDADPDIPIYRQAKAEFARLQ